MLPLRDLQRTFAAALASGDPGALLGLVAPGPLAAADRLSVYIGNREAALVNALRLTYPAIEALVGEAFFASVAQEFTRVQPPASPLLTLYGASFAAFLEDNPRAAGLPYLADIARLEWAVADVSQRARGFSETKYAVGAVSLAFSTSLTLLPLRTPAAAIWRAALDADEAALARIDLDRRPAATAIWRAGAGANAVELSYAAAAFIQRLMRHGDPAAAVAAAAAHAVDPIPIITDEILQADFVRLESLAV